MLRTRKREEIGAMTMPTAQPTTRSADIALLSDDMNRAEIVEVLEHLPRRRHRHLLEVEPEVVAYLIGKLKAR
jgi:hypothetical protein